MLLIEAENQTDYFKEMEENGVLVVASSELNKKQRIYHRCGCMYARRIKMDNRMEMSTEQAQKRHYKECKYCSGLRGDVNVHKKAFATWEEKKKLKFTYSTQSNTLYIQTEIGFWKVFMKEELGKYLLYHRNVFSPEMSFVEAIRGDFHRQADVKATESMEKLVGYIIAHDRAKVTIRDDYRKLHKSTKKQKKYYRAAQRRHKKEAVRRLDEIFASLEKSESGLKEHSFC